ncbi:MAG: hypothetical protein FRX49_10934 [Trebouxia sp. A1-2]|nr:MAG: hypothetical protein FRX49_10934 [Trebouxia sp. A1-2]
MQQDGKMPERAAHCKKDASMQHGGRSSKEELYQVMLCTGQRLHLAATAQCEEERRGEERRGEERERRGEERREREERRAEERSLLTAAARSADSTKQSTLN